MNRPLPLMALMAAICALCGAPDQAVARGKGSESATPKESYIAMGPLTGMVPRRDGRRSSISVEVGLDITDGALHAHALLSRPRLSAAYSEIARTTGARLRHNSPPDIEAIRVALQSATDQVLGRPGAKVLMGTVVVH